MPEVMGNRCGRCARFRRIRIAAKASDRKPILLVYIFMKIEEAILYLLAQRGGGLRTEQMLEAE